MTEHKQWLAEYDRTFLSELRKLLLSLKSQATRELDKPSVRVEDVRIDSFEDSRHIVILFRDLDRSECLFRFDWVTPEEVDNDPCFSATVAWANFDETLYAVDLGLPEECSSEGINWI